MANTDPSERLNIPGFYEPDWMMHWRKPYRDMQL
jgi:hypothetical protein